MVGFPKTLNTKEDYEYIRANFCREEWLPAYQALLDTAKDWFFVKKLEDGETAPAGDGYKVVEDQQTADGSAASRSLYHYEISPTCKLLALGFTFEEVEAAVGILSTVD